MRIAIVNLTSGGLSGGYRKYVGELLPTLSESTVGVFFHPNAAPAVRDRFPNALSWPAGDHLFGYRRLRAQLRSLHPDVIFFPTGRRLNVDAIPTVVMVRNMEPLAAPLSPGVPAESVRNLARAAATWNACRRATRVIAVSRYVSDFLVERFRIRADKIGVVYHGVDGPPRFDAVSPPKGVPGDIGDFLFTAGFHPTGSGA